MRPDMKNPILCTLVALAALGAALPAEDLVLVDGRYLHVRVLEATDARVKVRMLENDGEIWIPWSLIREDDRRRLRIRYGFEEDESEKVINVEGVRILGKSGADEWFGVPVAPLDLQALPETIELWIAGRKETIKREFVRVIEPATIPALKAYSREQLYERKLAERNPAEDDLEGQWDLARFSMLVDYHTKAIEHLMKVKALDPEFEPERVSNYLTRMEFLAKNAEITKAISDAKDHVRSRRFDRARTAFAEIIGLPNIPPVLKAHAEQTRDWAEQERAKHFKIEVRRAYFDFLDAKIGKLSRDPKLKMKDAQKELRSDLHKEIIADIASKFGLDPKTEVQKWFEDRVVNVPVTASYGTGSFIVLGVAPGAREREQQLQQAMARAAAQQRSQQGNNNRQGSFTPEGMKFPKQKTPDEWWKDAESGTKKQWMKAWFAEQCKILKVVSERREDCGRCGAKGTIAFDGPQGETIYVTCPDCHGHRYNKAVSFK
jgi:hypothetical protein